MSSGYTHSTVTILSSIGLSLLPTEQSAVLAVGCLAGTVLTPDLDLDGFTEADGIIRRGAGYLPMAYWRTLWRPYRIAVKHRSFWSHTPVLSTIVRLLYLVCPLIVSFIKDQDSSGDVAVIGLSLIAQLFAVPFWGLVWLVYMYPVEALWFVCGLAVSDFAHWVFDQLF